MCAPESCVAGGVQECDALARAGHANLKCANVLRDAARFTSGHVRAAQPVQQRRLAMVNVADNGDHRCARQLFVLAERGHNIDVETSV